MHMTKRVIPTIEEVAEYCAERGNGLDPEEFWCYYDSQGWKKANGRPVLNWRSCVVTWEKKAQQKKAKQPEWVRAFLRVREASSYLSRYQDDEAKRKHVLGQLSERERRVMTLCGGWRKFSETSPDSAAFGNLKFLFKDEWERNS